MLWYVLLNYILVAFLRALICTVNMCIVPTNPDNLDKYPPFQLTCSIIFANTRFMPRPMAKSKPMSMLPIFIETGNSDGWAAYPFGKTKTNAWWQCQTNVNAKANTWCLMLGPMPMSMPPTLGETGGWWVSCLSFWSASRAPACITAPPPTPPILFVPQLFYISTLFFSFSFHPVLFCRSFCFFFGPK